MKITHYHSALGLALCMMMQLTTVSRSSAITIDSARTLPLSTIVTVSGIVTNGPEFGNARHLQDESGGILLFDPLALPTVLRGDSITVTGELANYFQKLELINLSVTSHGSGFLIPAAMDLPPSTAFSETYESQLVRIPSVTFVNGGDTFSTSNASYDIISGLDTFEVRVLFSTDIAGTLIPSGTVAITGVMSQFDFSDPAVGYQLWPRDLSDIVPVPIVPGVVTTTANIGPGSLRDVIAAASPGSTITFDPSLSGSTITLDSQIDITQNVTITGPGSDLLTLSAITNQRVFNISAGISVNISDLTFSGVNYSASPAEGGAIYNQSDLTLEDCDFDGNTVADLSGTGVSGGAAVYSQLGTLVAKNCTFTGNTGNSTSGAIAGATVRLTTGKARFLDCLFDANAATAGAIGGGSAIFAGSSADSLVVLRTILSNNSSIATGSWTYGAVQAKAVNILIDECYFQKNTASNTGVSTADGAGLWVQGSTTVLNTTFSKNKSICTTGAARSAAITYGSNPLTVNSCTFSGNIALATAGGSTRGAAIGNNTGGTSAGFLTVTNSTFVNNQLINTAGGTSASIVLYTCCTSPSIVSGSLFAYNLENGLRGKDIAWGNMPSGGYNLNDVGDNVSVTTGDIRGTEAAPLNVGIDTVLRDNGGTVPTHALLCISPGLNAGNPSDFTPDQIGQAVVNGVRDIGAYESPGFPTTAIVTSPADSGPGSLRDAFNSACPGDTIIFDPSLAGTTINIGAPSLNITHDLVIIGPDTSAQVELKSFGFFFIERVFTNRGGHRLTIKNLTIKDGDAPDGPGTTEAGGAIYSNGTLVAENCNFLNNMADWGGAIYFDGDSAIFRGCYFDDNKSFGVLVGNGGGAIYASAGAVVVDRCVFTNNRASEDGGAILARASSLTVSRSTIVKNRSAFGGTVGGGIYVYNFASLKIDNSIVARNTQFGSSSDVDFSGFMTTVTSNGYNIIGNGTTGGTFPATTGDQVGTAASPLNPEISSDPVDVGGAIKVFTPNCISRALNAGDPLDLTSDALGSSVIGVSRDVGAYEAPIFPTNNLQATNLVPAVTTTWEHCGLPAIEGFHVYRQGTPTSISGDLDTTANLFLDNFATGTLHPGAFEPYCVRAYSAADESVDSCALGRIRPDGLISGAVFAQSGAAIADVQVCAYPPSATALALDGVDDFIITEYPLSIGNQGTFSAWLYRSDWNPGATEGIASNEFTSGSNGAISLRVAPSTGLTFQYGGSGQSGNVEMSHADSSWADSSWHHVLVTWDRNAGVTTLRMYFDELPVADTTTSLGLVNTSNWQIGRTADLEYWQGNIDEVMLWSKVLDSTMLSLRSKRIPVASIESELDLYYRFETEALPPGNTMVADYSGGGINHVPLRGGASLAADAGYPMGYCNKTNVSGSYALSEVFYAKGGGTTFSLKPTPDREYDPGQHVPTLDATLPTASVLNFTDTTVLSIEGVVTFPDINTTGKICVAAGVTIRVTGPEPVVPDTVVTNMDGEFSVIVPDVGDWTITPIPQGDYAGHTFSPDSIVVPVVNDVVDQEFSDITQRLLIGSFRGSCPTGIPGDAFNIFTDSVRIRIYSPNTNDPSCVDFSYVSPGTSNAWAIPLPPFEYIIEIDQVYVGGTFSDDIKDRLVVLNRHTMTADLREQSDTTLFLYKAPPTLAVTPFSTQRDVFDGCGGAFVETINVVEQLVPEVLTMSVTESYDFNSVTTTCPVTIETLGLVFINDPASGFFDPILLDSTATVDYSMMPLNVRRVPGTSGPAYALPFTADALIDGDASNQYANFVVVEGWGADSGTNFIAKSPELPTMILRDPPGDGSQTRVLTSETNCLLNSITVLADTTSDEYWSLNLGNEFSISSGFGVSVGVNFDVWYNHFEEYTYGSVNQTVNELKTCVTRITEDFTSADEAFVGPDADIVIGAAYVFTFSLGDDVRYNEDSCRIVSTRNLAMGRDSVATTYRYTRGFIRDFEIPKLQNLADIQPLVVDTLPDGSIGPGLSDSAKIWLNQIDVWNQVLKMADDQRDSALAGTTTNEVFSGGAGTTITSVTETTGSYTLEYDLFNESNSYQNELGFDFGGLGAYGGWRMRESLRKDTTIVNDSTLSTSISFTLYDDDVGDGFSVDIGTDPLFKTPVFKTIGGQTSCPAEGVAVTRDTISFFIDKTFEQVDPPSTTAFFTLTLDNISTVAGDPDRTFYVALTNESNQDGASVFLGGGSLVDIPRSVTIPTGGTITQALAVQKDLTLAYRFENLRLIVFAACEIDKFNLGLPVAILGDVKFTVNFAAPCADVSLFQPANGWLVNQATPGNSLPVSITGYDLGRLQEVKLQYRQLPFGFWSNVLTVDSATLDSSGSFYEYLWDVSLLDDADYEIRLEIQCDGAYSYSPIVTGTINLLSLQVESTIPFDGGVLLDGVTPSATFNEDLFCPLVGADNVEAYLTDDGTNIALEDPICGGGTVTIPVRTAVTPICSLENRWVTWEAYDMIDQFGNLIDTARWTFYVDRKADPVLTLTASSPSTIGGSDGEVDLTVSGLYPPYSYSWSNGATTEDLTALEAGTYVVTVTDAECSFVTDSITVIDPASTPVNDICSNAILVGPGVHPFTTVAATGPESSSCGGGTDTASVWFFYTPTQSGTARVSTCGSDFNTVLSVRLNCGSGELACNDDDVAFLACGGDASAFQVPVNAGSGAYIRIAGAGGSSGTGILTIEENPPVVSPANDDCVNATAVGPGVHPFTTLGATGSEVSSCGDGTDTASVWFFYTPTQSGTARVSTCGSSFNTILSVRLTCGSGELACNDDDAALLACGGDASAFEVNVSAGVGAYIRVAGAGGASGGGLLTIEENPPAAPCTSPPTGTASVASAGSVTLSWNAVASSVACEISGRPLGTPNFKSLPVIFGTEPTSKLVAGSFLTPGGTFEWRVRCACSISPPVLTQHSIVDSFTMPLARTIEQEKYVSLYPNPARRSIHVDMQGFKEEWIEIRIADLAGRVVRIEQVFIGFDWQVVNIDLAGLAGGLYALAVLSDDVHKVNHFVKED